MAELLISAVPSGVTGWRSLALVDELTGAALDVLVMVMVDELTGFHKSGSRPSMCPISRRSARKQHHRTVVEAVEMVGQCPWVPCQLARPRPRWTT